MWPVTSLQYCVNVVYFQQFTQLFCECTYKNYYNMADEPGGSHSRSVKFASLTEPDKLLLSETLKVRMLSVLDFVIS